MGSKAISTRVINDVTKIANYTDKNQGFWLYDTNRGMNLSMRAESEEDALIDALEYYQRRLVKVEDRDKALRDKVEGFLTSLDIEDFDLLD